MSAIKVNYEGKEIEVELPENYVDKNELSETHVERAFFDEQLKSQVNKKAAATRKAVEEELKGSDSFFASIAKQRGIPLDEQGKYKAPKEQTIDIDKIKSEVEQGLLEKEVKPRDEKLRKLLDSKLQSEIIQAASEVGIKKSLIKTISEDAAPPIVNMMRSYFGYDEEHDYFAVREGDSFKFSSTSNNKRPYMGAKELLEALKKQESWQDFFEDTRQRGSSYNNDGNNRGNYGTVRTKKDLKTNIDKSKFISEYGQKAYLDLPQG